MKTFEIDGLSIPFDPDWKNIAISVSGGADSALLTYLICNQIQTFSTTVHLINHIRCWKTKPWQQHDADSVIDWMAKKFPNISFIRHTNFISPELEYANVGPSLIDEYGKAVSGDNIEQRAYAEYICYKNQIDAYYNAVTRNPRSENFNGMKERDIEKNSNNQHLEIMLHMDRWALHPFRFTEKSWVIKQYYNSDIVDLLDLTRSCEGTFKDLDYKTYKPGWPVPTCGECFWCKERKWAIEQNSTFL
jgi:hypothetical protein